jgi:hypothetical protein
MQKKKAETYVKISKRSELGSGSKQTGAGRQTRKGVVRLIAGQRGVGVGVGVDAEGPK